MKHTKRTLVGILSRTERTLSGGLLNHRNKHPLRAESSRLCRGEDGDDDGGGGFGCMAAAGAWPEADRKIRRERGGEGDGMMIVGAWMVMLRVTVGYGGDGRNLAGYERGCRKLERRGGEARVDK
ncbi:hypothetical protein Tco_0477502 [Tanacetum coccineum]